MNPRLQALIAALVTVGIAAILPASWRMPWFAALLILTAGIYIGGALPSGRHLGLQLLQAGGLLALVAAAWTIHPLALAAGWMLHPAWDLLHHRHIHTDLPAWVIPWCLVYDVIIGLAIIAGTLAGWLPV